VIELAAPRARRLHARRSLIAGAPTTPGVYLFRDRNDTVLYVGKARDLRARLRSYFAGNRQRPAVEAALGALARVEWRELGSELEAALEELRLIRELRPPANARGVRLQSYLRRRGGSWVVTAEPTRFGPIASKRRAQLAARALAARVRDRVAALEAVAERVAELDRLRAEEICVLAPAREPGFWRVFVVAGGRVAARTIPRGAAGRLEIRSSLADAARMEPSLAPEDASDLLVISGFIRKPPPELRLARLELDEILAA
jgi:excinuclease UvrABC nuclease subunit